MDDMKRLALKNRIRIRFKNKPDAVIRIRLKNKKVLIRYMHGARYSVARKTKNGISQIALMTDIDGVMDIIIKEKESESPLGALRKFMK